MFGETLKKIIRDEKGMTLMELVLSMTLIAIIALAAFQGMRFAYMSLSASDELAENVYTLQGDMENDLSLVGVAVNTSGVSSAALSNGAVSANEETILFNWETGSGLADFQTTGVTVERDAEGGEYLDETVYIFVPVENTDQ